MPDKPKILFVNPAADNASAALEHLRSACDVVAVATSDRALQEVSHQHFDGLFWAEGGGPGGQLEHQLHLDRILQSIPDGVALLNSAGVIVWANDRVCRWSGLEIVVGRGFYEALCCEASSGIDQADPLREALATGRSVMARRKTEDNRYYQIHLAPLRQGGQVTEYVILTVRDVTKESLQEQKLDAILKAGKELADLTADELASMSVEDRKELLKSNILHFTKHLLNFDVVEVRLREPKTGRLKSLLAEGLTPEATQRDLYALPRNNGVTGWVAANGKSYLCDDTASDPLYIEGCCGARSSLTVPLIFHDEVIGTFNVESPQPHAFGESDLRSVEIFSRDVASAIHTLELLEVEMTTSAWRSVEAIHSGVALPVDSILNNVVNIVEQSASELSPAVVERLREVLQGARDIKQIIQRVGQMMAPAEAELSGDPTEQRCILQAKRILVADQDDSIRAAAHQLLEPLGSIVETTRDGAEAVCMARSMMSQGGYDVIIADIKLPDMNGYQLMLKLKELMDPVPLVLMTGYGYDPGHSLVNARKAGLPSYAQLFKPFRPDQVRETLKKVLEATAHSTSV